MSNGEDSESKSSQFLNMDQEEIYIFEYQKCPPTISKRGLELNF